MPSDDLIIEPAAAPLSATDGRFADAGRRFGWKQARRTLAVAFPVLLAAAAVFVFLLLPPAVVDRSRAGHPPTSADGQAAKPVGRARSSDSVPAPYEALTIEQVRREAEVRLDGFLALQVRLEDELNADGWGAAELEAAKMRALTGDALFKDEDYALAGDEYAAAVQTLEDLLTAGEHRFSGALAEGERALAALDETAAAGAFERAAAVHPDDPRVASGRQRAARLPEVKRLLLESDRALLREDHERAAGLLQDVRKIEPNAPGLSARMAQVAAGRSQAKRKALLSAAFEALDTGDHDTAGKRFEKALAAFPGDSAALAGAQQAERGRILAQIATLRASALAQVGAEDWQAALKTYDQALAIDGTLRFAVEGRVHAEVRLALVRAVDRIIADPPLLSSNDEFAAAQELLARADATVRTPGPRFGERLAELRAVLELATNPVPLVLVSDGETDVVIQQVGSMGTFARTELTLRPGRYVIVGSRDGCRDVRKEIVLAPNMGPVDIRCSERI